MRSPGSPRSVGVGGEPSTAGLDVSVDKQEAAEMKKSSASSLVEAAFRCRATGPRGSSEGSEAYT